MIKGLLALSEIIIHIDNEYAITREAIENFLNIHKELKALEIIKEKLSPIALTTFYPMTQEEFELVKEVLLS